MFHTQAAGLRVDIFREAKPECVIDKAVVGNAPEGLTIGPARETWVALSLHGLNNAKSDWFYNRDGSVVTLGSSANYIFRRYCPPTSNSALVICPNEHTRTASINTAKTFSFRITACCSRFSIFGVSLA